MVSVQKDQLDIVAGSANHLSTRHDDAAMGERALLTDGERRV
jgi:hypothetical protein